MSDWAPQIRILRGGCGWASPNTSPLSEDMARDLRENGPVVVEYEAVSWTVPEGDTP